MFEVFEKYIRAKINLADHELEMIKKAAIERKFKRKQYLLEQGDICRHYCFVAKGCLRMYRVSDDKSRHMLRFAVENWWISDRASLTTGLPSHNNIDALEDTEVILWSKRDFDELMKQLPDFRSYIEEMISKSFNVSQQRIFTIISASAEEKYLDFIRSYPDFYSRIPLHMIASYLGVSGKTLSRIRRSYSHQQLPKEKNKIPRIW